MSADNKARKKAAKIKNLLEKLRQAVGTKKFEKLYEDLAAELQGFKAVSVFDKEEGDEDLIQGSILLYSGESTDLTDEEEEARTIMYEFRPDDTADLEPYPNYEDHPILPDKYPGTIAEVADKMFALMDEHKVFQLPDWQVSDRHELNSSYPQDDID